MAGLGEARTSCPQEDFRDLIPALGEAGGYEILRKQEENARQLMQIPHLPNGFTVQFLKTALGQAKAFLRLIQRYPVIEIKNA